MNSKSEKSDKSIYIVLVVFLLFILYVLHGLYVVNPRLDKEFLTEYRIVQGEITQYSSSYFGFPKKTIVTYYIDQKKKEYELFFQMPCRTSDGRIEKNKKEIFSWYFPVAVSLKDSDYVLPLLRPEDFEIVNIPYPDSMKYRACPKFCV